MRYLLLLGLSAAWLWAQEVLPKPDLAGLRYQPLPLSASVQGTVHLTVSSNEIQLVSGHPMLVRAAKENAEKWALGAALSHNFSVYYSFRLVEPVMIEVDQPIGDAFGRFFLRVLGRPTSQKVKVADCDHVGHKETSVQKITEDIVEIDIVGTRVCVEPQAASVAAGGV